ncbi:hypothetical protein TNCV_847001 [Trichonephila clavipes]|nr:hypothetical protein TNCV_847001 [Trichonephila clavipes]
MRPPNDHALYSSISSDSPHPCSSNSIDMDKLKEDKKMEPEAPKQEQWNIVRNSNFNRPSKPTRDDSSISSNDSFYSHVSFVINFH